MTSPNTTLPKNVTSYLDLLSAWIEAQMAYDGQPGLSIGIVHDQELIWAQGFGYADVARQVPATPTTLYRIASITKLFTATAILQLRDAGKLQLDDPVTRHLPWFDIQTQHTSAPPITIRHLLTHTAGLPSESASRDWDDDRGPTRQQLQETISSQKTILPSESEARYSNLGFILAGEIVAAVSGEDYADYIRAHILDPLGMDDTLVETPDHNHPRLATGYGRRLPDSSRSVAPLSDLQALTPAAGMSSTVEGLARFAALQFQNDTVDGQQILRASTLREMQRVHWLDADWRDGRGLGFGVERDGNRTYIGHTGGEKGFRSEFRLCPADKIGVIALTNANDGDPFKYAERTFQWVAPTILEDEAASAATREPDPAWQQYVGRYRNFWSDLQILVLNGDLVAINPSLPDPLRAMEKLIPVTAHTFRLEGSNQGAGETVTFRMDGAGHVERIEIAANCFYPVTAW